METFTRPPSDLVGGINLEMLRQSAGAEGYLLGVV